MLANRSMWLVLGLGSVAMMACGEYASRDYMFQSVNAPLRSVVVSNYQGHVTILPGTPGGHVEGRMSVFASGFDTPQEASAAVDAVALVETGNALDMNLAVAVPPAPALGGFDVGLELRVPPDVRVSVTTENGAVSLADVNVARIETSDGAISLRRTLGDVTLRTSNASIDVNGHEGDLEASTYNGAIDLQSVYGNVRGSTTNGAIVAEVLPPRDGEIALTTTYGEIELRIPDTFGADLSASTTAPGTVTVQNVDFFPLASAPGEANGQINYGFGVIDLRTTQGNINVIGSY